MVPNKTEAISAGKKLVANKLAACINIIDNMTSIYQWNGEVQESSEVILLAKTTAKNWEQVANELKEVHSYECPAIFSLKASNIQDSYLSWIKQNCKK